MLLVCAKSSYHPSDTVKNMTAERQLNSEVLTNFIQLGSQLEQ